MKLVQESRHTPETPLLREVCDARYVLDQILLPSLEIFDFVFFKSLYNHGVIESWGMESGNEASFCPEAHCPTLRRHPAYLRCATVIPLQYLPLIIL